MAARFRFRLESLLKVRKALEEAAQRDLARALGAQEQARAHLGALQRSREEAVEARRTPPGAAVDLERLRAVERWLLALERRIAEAREQLRQADERVAAARQGLLVAHRNHLMLVRLKERRREQYDLEALREETRAMDEMAMLRFRFNPATPTREVTP